MASSGLNSGLTFVFLVGLGLSIYAYVIHLKLENDSKYKALCDINEHMSCTKVFKSKWARGLAIFSEESFFYKPNSLLGILFYSLQATLAQSNSLIITKLAYWSIFLANLLSLQLAYVLYFKLQDFCLVCVGIYAVNLISLIILNYKVRNIQAEAAKNAMKKRH